MSYLPASLLSSFTFWTLLARRRRTGQAGRLALWRPLLTRWLPSGPGLGRATRCLPWLLPLRRLRQRTLRRWQPRRLRLRRPSWPQQAPSWRPFPCPLWCSRVSYSCPLQPARPVEPVLRKLIRQRSRLPDRCCPPPAAQPPLTRGAVLAARRAAAAGPGAAAAAGGSSLGGGACGGLYS